MENITFFPPITNDTVFPSMANATGSPPTNESAPSASNSNVTNVVIVSLLSFVIIAGVIGNFMVIVTILGKQSMRSPCNLFIMNIAIADLLVSIILTPLRMAELFKGWPLGEFLCRFVGPIQDVIVCVSVVTHTVIALERHRGIVTPFKPKLSLRKAKIVIAVIYCACYVLVGLPLALVLREVDTYCLAQWPSIKYRRIFEVFLVAFFVFLPLVVQTVTYIKIVATIKKEDASTQISRSGTVEQRRNQIRKKARLVKMLIILVVVFQVCYIPRGIFMLIYEFASKTYKMENHQSISIASIATITLYYLKHVFNPFILFAMSTEFRKNCFLCQKTCRKKLDIVSSVARYVSQHSNSEEKEMKTLCETSPELCKEHKDKETNV